MRAASASSRPPRSPLLSMPALMKVLSGENRRAILFTLIEGPMDVSSLVKRLRLDVSALSHDLRRLRSSGLVWVVKKGRHHVYALGASIKAKQTRTGATLTCQVQRGGFVSLHGPVPRSK